MIHVLQWLIELLIVLSMVVILLDYGPVDVHLVAAGGCGAIFLLVVQVVIAISTLTVRRVRRWWTEPPGQFWKRGGSWMWVDAPRAEDKSIE